MSLKPTVRSIPSVKMRGFVKMKRPLSTPPSYLSQIKFDKRGRAIPTPYKMPTGLEHPSKEPSEGFARTQPIRPPAGFDNTEGMASIQIESPQTSQVAQEGEPLFRDESDIANFESVLNNAIRNPFVRDVEQVLDSGIQYGYHNFDPLRDQDMVPGYSRGTPLGNTINFKSGPRCTHMDGQFIMIECPASAANVYSFGTIPHILERIPVGAVIIALTPVNKTVYPHTITPDGAWTIDFVPGDPDSWNEDVFRVKSNRYSGGSNGLARAVVVVF